MSKTLQEQLVQAGFQDSSNIPLPEAPTRYGYIPSAGSRYVVMNGENRALKALESKQIAEFNTTLATSRRLLDLRQYSRYDRRMITNILNTKISMSSHAESPAIEPPKPKKQKQTKRKDPDAELNEVLHEMTDEVHKIAMSVVPPLHPDQVRALNNSVAQIARYAGREAALDLIREVDLMLYTDVWDNQTGYVVNHFPGDHQAAATMVNVLNDGPAGRTKLGKMRYKTVKPGHEE